MTNDEFEILLENAKAVDQSENTATELAQENGIELAETQGIQNANAEIIAIQNDAFRKHHIDEKAKQFCRDQGIGGKCVVTHGVQSLGPIAPLLCIRMVGEFSDFSDENDPHGERDFGSFQFLDQRVLFKIVYYDVEFKNRSEDPTNPKITRRVLTVMLASEY